MKKWVPTIIVAVIAIISIFFIDTEDKGSLYKDLHNYFENTFESFESASLETTITSGEEVVYLELIEVEKGEENNNIKTTTKELSDDMYSSELYEISSSEGTMNDDDMLKLFSTSLSVEEKYMSNLEETSTGTNMSNIRFVIIDSNIDDVFGEDVLNSVDGSIVFNIEIDNELVKEFRYEYLTKDGSTVIIKGNFQ